MERALALVAFTLSGVLPSTTLDPRAEQFRPVAWVVPAAVAAGAVAHLGSQPHTWLRAWVVARRWFVAAMVCLAILGYGSVALDHHAAQVAQASLAFSNRDATLFLMPHCDPSKRIAAFAASLCARSPGLRVATLDATTPYARALLRSLAGREVQAFPVVVTSSGVATGYTGGSRALEQLAYRNTEPP